MSVVRLPKRTLNYLQEWAVAVGSTRYSISNTLYQKIISDI